MKKFRLYISILFLFSIMIIVFGCPNTTKPVGGRNVSSPNNAPDQALIDSIKNSKGGVKKGKPDSTSKSNEHR